jgi:hypothetical protein
MYLNIRTNMPFNLEAAKSGAPIFQRYTKQPVKFVAHVPEARADQRVVVLRGDMIETFPESGWYLMSGPGYMDILTEGDDDDQC